jgi:NitT/TauT family transport system ATP-binding protein
MTPLPHATINRLMGLVEAMHRTAGSDSVKELAQALQLDLEDLLPLLSAAQLLRWAVVRAGRYDLTAEGRQVAAGGELVRKARFRERISSLPALRAILALLAEDDRVPEERAAAAAELPSDSEEARRQIDTIISWGRYAEILDYDEDTHSFVRPPQRARP